MKQNKPVFLIPLSLLIFFLLWSFFQPSGILATINNNLSLVSYVKQLANTPEQFDPHTDPSNSPHVGMLAARQALRQDHADRAYELITPILNYSDSWVMSTHAEILFADDKVAEAITVWENNKDVINLKKAAINFDLNKDLENLLLTYQALHRLDPEGYTSVLAIVLDKLGRIDDTALVLQSSIKNFEDSKYYSNWSHYLAEIYASQQKPQEAEQIYLQLIIKDPSDYTTWKNLGLLYLTQLNTPEKSVACFQEMIEISSENPVGYILLAQAFENSGNFVQALQTFQQLSTLFPDNPTALQGIERLTLPNQPTP